MKLCSKYSLLLFFLLTPLLAVGFQGVATMPNPEDSLRNFYIDKANKYLIKHDLLWDYLDIHKDRIDIYASPSDKKNKTPEFCIYWDEIKIFNRIVKGFRYEDAFATYKNKKTDKFDSVLISRSLFPDLEKVLPTQEQPLKGKKIALDPGHVGNDMKMGLIESRFIKMNVEEKDIQFAEAELTYATAYFLKELLTEKGAEVILTRSGCHTTALGVSFPEWYKKRMPEELNQAEKEGKISKEFASWLKHDASETKIFQKYFQTIDWRERCRIINNFKPDITVIIHFNADEENITWTHPTLKNYNVTFVGGGYVKDELLKIEDRFQFLRQLVSDDIETSIELSDALIKSFETCLKVPVISEKHETNNIKNFSLRTNKNGVYARNLALTRYIFGTLCYGETLLQDNIKECKELNKKDLVYPCGRTSSRVKEVANAYFKGILNYYNSKDY